MAQARTVRRIVALGAVTATLAATPAIASTDSTPPPDTGGAPAATRTVGIVLYSSDDYQVAYQSWLEQFGPEMGIDFLFCNQELDAEKGVACIDDMITNQVDGIVYHPTDPSAAIAPVESAIEAGIPIAMLVQRPGDIITPFLDINEYDATFEAGAEAARVAQERWPDQPLRAVLLDIPQLDICAVRRMGGFEEGIKSIDPDAEVERLDGDGSREDSLNLMTDYIQSGAEFNIVSACTGEMLAGAMAALEADGRLTATDKQPDTEYVFAIDGNRTQLEQLLDPTSPVMRVMGLTPRDNAQKVLDLIIQMMDGDVAQDEDFVVDLGPAVIDPECDAVNTYLADQYLAEPLDCA